MDDFRHTVLEGLHIANNTCSINGGQGLMKGAKMVGQVENFTLQKGVVGVCECWWW